jgi:glycine dehydrogenase
VRVGETRVGITLDEAHAPEIIEGVWRAFGITRKDETFTAEYRVPENMHRRSDFLTHPIFPHEPGRDGDDALHAAAGGSGPCA